MLHRKWDTEDGAGDMGIIRDLMPARPGQESLRTRCLRSGKCRVPEVRKNRKVQKTKAAGAAEAGEGGGVANAVVRRAQE